MIKPTGEVILTNDNGVNIDGRCNGHHASCNAICHCGEPLLVAPPVFHPNHKKGDPVMVCRDHGTHSFRFLDLVVGKQPPPKTLRTAQKEANPCQKTKPLTN